MTNEEAIAILERKTTIPGDGYTWEQIEEAIDVAVAALKVNQVGSEPLTLDQLRKKINEPVYLYIYDTALDSGWHILKAVTEDKIIFRGWNTVYVPISSIGKCFDLYAYPPAHIDREAWVNADEHLPEKQKDVLMLFDTGNMAVGFWHDRDESLTFWCAYTDDGFYTDCDSMPTHWMPLPEPPEEG